MTTDQLYQLALIIIGGIGALMTAYAIRLKGQAKVSVTESEREKLETETDSYVTRRITDRFAEATDDNRELQKQLRDCEVSKATEIAARDAQIKELQRLVHDVGERNDMQGKLLRESAGKMTRMEQLIEKLEIDKRTLELKLSTYIGKDES